MIETYQLAQGSCKMKLFEAEAIREIILKEGQTLEISAKQYHIHSNPTGQTSITL